MDAGTTFWASRTRPARVASATGLKACGWAFSVAEVHALCSNESPSPPAGEGRVLECVWGYWPHWACSISLYETVTS